MTQQAKMTNILQLYCDLALLPSVLETLVSVMNCFINTVDHLELISINKEINLHRFPRGILFKRVGYIVSFLLIIYN